MSINIMIVEDEVIVARDLQGALEALGYRVPAIADSGELAIQQASELRPDLVLMDIRLAGELDGISAAQVIREQCNIPVVYLTAHADEETLSCAVVTRPLGYLIKPFDEVELRAVIEVALYKHETELRLEENAQWLSTVLHSIGDGVIATDIEGHITLLNPVAEKLTGWSMAEALGRDIQNVFRLIHETGRVDLPSPVYQALKTQQIVRLPPNTLLVRKDGLELPIEDSVAAITLHRGTVPLQNSAGHITGAVVIFRDVTQQRLSTAQLHRHAFFDDLTNLPNRRWFRERLTDALERIKRSPDFLFAVLILDLDRFKFINDSLGHPIGDRLLVAVADRLVQSSRVLDTVVRLGGDEFAILLECLKTEKEVLRVAERIQQKLSLPFYLEGYEVSSGASIGIALGNPQYEGIEELIRDADIAMYRAKAAGKSCYRIFDAEMRTQALQTFKLEYELRRVVERQQLSVYYQPIVALATGKTSGFEALVRWQHPQRGLVSAGEFMPFAEEMGLSLGIDAWVLAEACRQLKYWQDCYPTATQMRVNVNLSGRQVIHPNLVKQITGILRESQLKATDLTLELTENTLIENPVAAAKALTELGNLNIRIALDDFGTGYSSLKHLHELTVHSLKLDQSFVSAIDQKQDSLEIVQAMILLGKTLGLTTVAEGIETEAQLSLLRNMHCDFGQGYFFAKPLPAAEAELLLTGP